MQALIWNIVRKFKIWADMIKLEHTIFSAPFMLSSMFLAADPFHHFQDSGSIYPRWTVVFWAFIALIGARSAAMSINRFADAKFDSLNPRTSQRAIPAGKISSRATLYLAIAGFLMLLLAAMALPKICLYLFPLAVAWLVFYSYTKRFTWLCHLVLGIALGGAVLGGWLAVTGEVNIQPILFGLAVAFWVCGFDILYSLQDFEFDRSQKLHSIPARFGVSKAIFISRISHLISIIFFVLTGLSFISRISPIILFSYWSGFAALLTGIIIQHWLIHKDLSKVEIVFFAANSWISALFFLCILMGKILQGAILGAK